MFVKTDPDKPQSLIQKIQSRSCHEAYLSQNFCNYLPVTFCILSNCANRKEGRNDETKKTRSSATAEIARDADVA